MRVLIWYDSAAFSQLRGVILDLSGKQKKLGAVFVTALIAALTVFLNWFSGDEPPPPAEEPAAEELAPEEAPAEEAPAEEPAADVE